jgi:hypothetical protein
MTTFCVERMKNDVPIYQRGNNNGYLLKSKTSLRIFFHKHFQKLRAVDLATTTALWSCCRHWYWPWDFRRGEDSIRMRGWSFDKSNGRHRFVMFHFDCEFRVF